MANYWKLYKEAKAFYFSFGKIRCPALNDEEIIFDWRGFRHFLHKGKGKRPLTDQIRRFKLFFRISELIKDPQISVSGENNNKIIFWSLSCTRENEEIRAVIMQDTLDKKYFVSIMNHK
jgi:hypothetical protein